MLTKILLLQFLLKVPVRQHTILGRLVQVFVLAQRLPVGTAQLQRQHLTRRRQQSADEQLGDDVNRSGTGFVRHFGQRDERLESGQIGKRIALHQQRSGVRSILGRTLVQGGLQPLGIGWVFCGTTKEC